MRNRPLTPIARCLLTTCLLLLTAHCSLFTVFAQSTSATLSGTVVDQNGGVVPGVEVTIVNTSTSLQRHATTNSEGSFTVPLLPPGSYTVTARGQGFAPVEIPNVTMNVGDQKSLQVQLKAGNISEMVQISGDAPLINESPAVATVVDRQFVGNLPLNGRTFQSLIALSPGVVLTKATANAPGQFSVNGQRANANYFTVDGVSANIGVTPNATISHSIGGDQPGVGATGGTNNLVSIDALQEFKIQTSTYAAEYGRQPGGQISIITRSGTNQFHGSVFDYLRNDAMDANDWFANANRLSKPALRQNDFGGVFGGPLYLPRFGEGAPAVYNGKNRTFFFFSYEGLRLRLPLVGLTDVPSLAARQSAPSEIRTFLNAYPIPNGAENTSTKLAKFSSSFSNQATLNATSIRIDQALGNKATLFGRYNHAPSTSIQRGAGSNSLNTLSEAAVKTQTLTIGTTWALTGTVNHDLVINYSRNRGLGTTVLDNFGGAVVPDRSVLLPSATVPAAAFILSITGGVQSLISTGNSTDITQRQFNLVDSLSIIGGSHQFKFGIDYRRLSPIVIRAGYTQSLSATVNQLLSRVVASATIAAPVSPVFPINKDFSAYGQDTWKATRRLTLTYGLRWEVNTPPSAGNGRFPITATGVAENPATATLAPVGTPLWKTTYGNFAPRLGVAYQLSQRSGRESVLRGGFGVFYDLGIGASGFAFGVAYPFQASKALNATTGFPTGVPFPLSSTLSAAPLPPNPAQPVFPITDAVEAFAPNFKLPYTYQWNASIEQSAGKNQTLSATYLGAAGRRQLFRQTILFNPNLKRIEFTGNEGRSDYKALQVQFQRRFARGLQALASYTYAKSTDDTSDDFTTNTPSAKIDPLTNLGPSDFDVRHAFNAAVTYNIPAPNTGMIGRAILRDWALDTIVTARSATPVNVTINRDLGFGATAFRPDLVPGVPLYLIDPAAPGGRRLNTAAFVVPTDLRQGNLTRNAARGLPVSQVDFAVRRQFGLTEKLKLQFRSEFFNIFNHPNFADPPSLLGSVNSAGVLTRQSSFGLSQTMLGRSLGSGGTSGGLNPLYQIGGPRSIEFALKLLF